MKFKLIYVVAKDEGEAKKIGRILVEERLAACVNIFPIQSVYRWKGKVEESREVGMFAKTKEELVDEVIKRLKELHSDEVPCVVCLGIEKGNEDFLEWIGKETK